MSGPKSRLSSIAGHLVSQTETSNTVPTANRHTLSPTFFLPRTAGIEPNAEAIYHITSNNKELRRSYIEFADRARGLAYYLLKNGFKKVGILLPNTPAFLESIYGIGGAGAVMIPINYRLNPADISYILNHSEADSVIVDQEFLPLLKTYLKEKPNIPFIVDTDTEATQGPLSGPFDEAVLEGLKFDADNGNRGWDRLQEHFQDDHSILAICYTSGTTARPKGVPFSNRGSYLAAMANVVEGGLNFHERRAHYLWTLPMFHAVGWTFPWAVVAVRGKNYCLRKIDYPQIWRILKEEQITHFNAAPTVNTLLCNAKEAERLPHTVHVCVAASTPSPILLEKMERLNLRPNHVYGLTETYGPAARGYWVPEWDSLPVKEKYSRMARQGYAYVTSLPLRVIKTDVPEGTIVDVERNGQEIGEVVFCGNMCAEGYYKDPEATRKLFAGGVLHSGDLAVWNPDRSILLLDRAKDIIISGGENISSVALESMLATHPEIIEAGVIGVADAHWGEIPKAFITIQAGSKLSGQDVITWAKHTSGISKFMVPKEVEVVPELPKTGTGKIRKNILREWAKGADRKIVE